MRQSLTAIPVLVLVSFLSVDSPAAGTTQREFGFATNVGLADPRGDNSYRSDQTLNFSFEYEKTNYAAYRATAGFLTIQGREPISPAAGTRDADALYVTGNIVLTPRFATVHPFFTAGLGVYSFRVTDNLDSQHNVELGINWGFGMDIQLLRHFALRGEYLFHYTTGAIANPIEALTIGGRFTF